MAMKSHKAANSRSALVQGSQSTVGEITDDALWFGGGGGGRGKKSLSPFFLYLLTQSMR